MDPQNRILLVALPFLLLACSSAQQDLPEPAGTSGPAIRSIQGRAHKSPLEGQNVEGVEGIVTAVLVSGRAPGFWIQDPRPDQDDATSEGIFVSTKGTTADVKTGDAVVVSGKIEEIGFPGSLTTTQITGPTVRVISQGQRLPPAIILGARRKIPDAVIDDDGMTSFDPGTDAIDFWESLEGMRVEIRDPVVVGASNRFGDMVLVADGGRNSRVRSVMGGVVVQQSAWNPDRITLEPRLVPTPPVLNVGDRFKGSITGIIDYNFNTFRLLNTSPLPRAVPRTTKPEVTALQGDLEHMTAATYNLLNISAQSDAEKFRKVAQTIAVNLRAPDIIGLQEVQDDTGPVDDGVVSGDRTFEKLIDAIVVAGGPRYQYRQIDPVNNQDGGQPGGNIRVGLLFNPDRVVFVDRGTRKPNDATRPTPSGSATRLTLTPGRIDPTNPCFAAGGTGDLAEPTRKSMAAELRFRGRPFFVIVNHLKSKRGDDPLFGARQPTAFNTEAQRTCQAEVIGRFVAAILTLEPRANVILLGDLNEHEFRTPTRRLVEVSGLINLIDRVPLAERYTYIYEGNSQTLDHIMVSPAIIDREPPAIDIVHVNTDTNEGEAASDHDPVVARLKM